MEYSLLEQAARERLGQRRFHHSQCVAEQAAAMAAAAGIDPEQARIAGILHDICKEMPEAEQLQYLRRHAILLDKDFLAHPLVWHGPVASLWIREHLGLEDEEALSAIWYHSTGKAAMTLLEQVVYLADFTSADRTFYDADCLRSIIKDSLDAGMLFCLRYTIQSVMTAGMPIIRQTWEAYNYYSEVLANGID